MCQVQSGLKSMLQSRQARRMSQDQQPLLCRLLDNGIEFFSCYIVFYFDRVISGRGNLVDPLYGFAYRLRVPEVRSTQKELRAQYLAGLDLLPPP